jgi:hypothetical protein
MLSPFGPRPAPSQTQRNDTQWGAGNWAYARSPVPPMFRPGQAQPIPAGPVGTPYQPFVNTAGQQFTGTMSFAPGTPQQYQNQAYGNWANRNGYFRPQVIPPVARQY